MEQFAFSHTSKIVKNYSMPKQWMNNRNLSMNYMKEYHCSNEKLLNNRQAIKLPVKLLT